MKSSIRAALAVGALALASSQAIASTVPVFNGMTPASVGTTNLGGGVFNPSYDELVVTGPGSVGVVTTLIDSSPEVQTVSYWIYADLNPLLGATTIGGLIDSWSYVDFLGTGTQSHLTWLVASGTQYVLKMASSGSLAGEGSTSQISAVPLPAAAWLFGSAVLGLGALRRKQKAGAKSEMALA
jgi:hypothetical protein